MKHQTYREWLQLLAYDDLENEEREILFKHLAVCDECREELESLKKLKEIISSNKPEEADDILLRDSRRHFLTALRIEKQRRTFWMKAQDYIRDFFTYNYKPAFAGAAVLIIGFALGWYLSPAKQIMIPVEVPTAQNTTGADSSFSVDDNLQLSNVRVVDSDPQGNVTVALETVKPVQVKGNIMDDDMRRILASSLTGENNAGARLRALNVIQKNINRSQMDPKIKEAVVYSAKYDDNPGVRREALGLLGKYYIDTDIKDALLYVLSNDQNSGNRVLAINLLSDFSSKFDESDRRLIDVLSKKAESEENGYIKMRAKNILQEVQNDKI